MAYSDLREFIKQLEKAGELKRITVEVDPILEMAEIADRTSKLGRGTAKAGGPALLFENVKGYPKARVLMNQFGSEARMKLALQVSSLDGIAGRIRTLLHPVTPTSMMDKLKMLPMLAEVGSFFPKVIAARDASCKQVIHRGEAVNLLELPILKTWPQDGGRFITLPCVITRDPKSGKRNVGMYRMQVYDGRTTGMHWQRQKVAAEHMRERLREAMPDGAGRVELMAMTAGGTAASAGTLGGMDARVMTKLRGERMEVAVAIGTDPAITFAAIVPAPPEVEEYLIAGFLRQKPVELVKAETVDLEVPAHAEYILEGYVELGELRTEGPFGDHTGFYTMEDEYPVFHLTAITHRKDPIYAATVVGKPPMEDAWMGKAVERIFLPLMQLTLPEIVDVNLPAEGVFHNLMIVSIRKSYAGQARKIMNGIWAMGQAMFTKCVIVVDEDCDVQDVAEVTLRVANNIDPERDIQFTLGPVDSLDHASRLPNFGSKMGIDATRKWAAEGFTRQWPPMLTMDPGVVAKVDAMWKKLGIGLLLMVVLGGSAWAQVDKPATVDCSVDGRALTCDRAEFLKRFAEARTLAMESQPRDRVADGQLATLSKSLGKTVVPVGGADLTLRVVRPVDTGFAVGTGDEELGSLRVFSEGRLVWVERYRGQPDTPWQVVVRGLTQQFQGTLAGR